MLLQVLDDGRLTDSKGRVVDFSNTIIIMTSNLGSEVITQKLGADREITEPEMDALRDELTQLLRQRLRPEFLNRIDETVVFRPLGRGQIRRIVEILFERTRRMAEKGNGLRLVLTDAAKDALAAEGFDAAFGARPLEAGAPAAGGEQAGRADLGRPGRRGRRGRRRRGPGRRRDAGDRAPPASPSPSRRRPLAATGRPRRWRRRARRSR